ncbi:MAG: AgmX/PglI C-terminal domain-containing protein [Deltaproteobacteria bacterium]|nr:AgmX/PglI C-terminal domain-containing protein [Deltaproteobacteria bacterium]
MWRMGLLVLVMSALACGGSQKQTSSPREVEDEGPDETESSPGEFVDPQKLDEISSIFRMKRPNVARCYTDAAQAGKLDKKSTGRITLSMAITPDGALEQVQVTETTLRSKDVEDCVVRVVSSWRLPAPEASVEFSFSYNFEPE